MPDSKWECTLALKVSNPPYEDGLWVQRAREGDAGAFEQLVLKYQKRIYNVCYRMVGHVESARDLTQEAFLKSYSALEAFDQKSSFLTWLYRIAINLSLSHRRKVHRASIQTSVDSADVMGRADRVREAHGQVSSNSPAARLSLQETQEAVRRALQQVGEEYRAVLILRDIESLDYQTIAEVLSIPIGTVRSRLHRGRVAMRELLQDLDGTLDQ